MFSWTDEVLGGGLVHWLGRGGGARLAASECHNVLVLSVRSPWVSDCNHQSLGCNQWPLYPTPTQNQRLLCYGNPPYKHHLQSERTLVRRDMLYLHSKAMSQSSCMPFPWPLIYCLLWLVERPTFNP